MGQERLGSVDHTPEVDPENQLVVAQLAVEEGTPGTDTGVVVDLVDHTEVLGNRVRVGLERDGVAHVQQLLMHARTECRDLAPH